MLRRDALPLLDVQFASFGSYREAGGEMDEPTFNTATCVILDYCQMTSGYREAVRVYNAMSMIPDESQIEAFARICILFPKESVEWKLEETGRLLRN